MGELYQAMDLFVLPSLFEGLALVLVETQCAGLRILVSDAVTDEIKMTDRMEYLPCLLYTSNRYGNNRNAYDKAG